MPNYYPNGITVKTAEASILGNNPLWTPTAGKRWCLHGIQIWATSSIATATGGSISELIIDLHDVNASIGITFTTTCLGVGTNPTSTAGWNSGMVNLNDFYIEPTLPDTPLNINLSALLLRGKVRAIAYGCEHG